ncbi:hypothetical protein TNCV_516391 [Trichonephila clavipes]|nr:hypothetical protein TNCV_516391 [Trichonephila clavipes]
MLVRLLATGTQDESGGSIYVFGDGSKDVQLSCEDDLRRAMFSSIDKVTAEIQGRSTAQDINKEDFQLKLVRIQAFVAATVTSCKKELIREKISDLWELDSLGIKDPSEKKSKLELQDLALNHFENTVLRDDEGRYIVNIP